MVTLLGERQVCDEVERLLSSTAPSREDLWEIRLALFSMLRNLDSAIRECDMERNRPEEMRAARAALMTMTHSLQWEKANHYGALRQELHATLATALDNASTVLNLLDKVEARERSAQRSKSRRLMRREPAPQAATAIAEPAPRSTALALIPPRTSPAH